MSFFEGRPEIAKKVTAKVQNYPSFVEEEAESIRTFGSSVAELFPALLSTSMTSSPLENKPISFNWMAALDYFTCREGHSLPIDDRVRCGFLTIFICA